MASLPRLHRADRAAGEDDLADPGRADLVEQPGQQASPGDGQAQGQLGQPEDGVVGADPQVAGERQGEAGTGGPALDPRDGHGGAVGEGIADPAGLLPVVPYAAAGRVLVQTREEFVPVAAEAEVPAGPGQHDHAHGRVGYGQHGEEFVQHGRGDGVPGRRAVQLDVEHGALALGTDRTGHRGRGDRLRGGRRDGLGVRVRVREVRRLRRVRRVLRNLGNLGNLRGHVHAATLRDVTRWKTIRGAYSGGLTARRVGKRRSSWPSRARASSLARPAPRQ